jgi:hypothetical protein
VPWVAVEGLPQLVRNTKALGSHHAPACFVMSAGGPWIQAEHCGDLSTSAELEQRRFTRLDVMKIQAEVDEKAAPTPLRPVNPKRKNSEVCSAP